MSIVGVPKARAGSTARSHAGKARISRDDLRDVLLTAGLDILAKDGLSSGAEGLTFKRVFEHVESKHGIRVTNASVIKRIWLNNEDFQQDVLSYAVRDENLRELDAALREADRVLEEADLSTKAGRREATREICRRAGATYSLAVSKSKTWIVFLGIWGNMASRPKQKWNQRVARETLLTYTNVTSNFAEVMAGFMDLLGLRLRTGFTLDQYSAAVIALADGCLIRDRLDPITTRNILVPGRQGAEDQEWWLFAIGLEGLIWHFMELDPDWRPPKA